MKRTITILLIMGCLITMCACSGGVAKNTVYSAEDLMDKQVGILSDTPTYHYLSGFENAGVNIRSFTDEDVMLGDISAGCLTAPLWMRFGRMRRWRVTQSSRFWRILPSFRSFPL